MLQFLRNTKTALQTRWQEYRSDDEDDGGSPWLKYLLILVGVYCLLVVVVGIYWSAEPDEFSPVEVARKYSSDPKHGEFIVGVPTTTTLIAVMETLLDKPGGYLSNDVTPPGVLLDNIPSWEYGVLIQVRDLTRVMRESFSRSQSQSKEDEALELAAAQFNFNHNSWILPASEDEYRRGIEALSDYLGRLMDKDEQNAQFYARADNLRYWLGSVETRLGGLSQNLSASVGQRRLNVDLAGDEAAQQSTAAPSELEIKTSWVDIDNVFYEARGSAWALIQFLRAIEMDFADVLRKKNALVSLQQIVRELEGTQQTLYSPMILNGSGFGILANHSLVMANYISRANAAIIDLRELLSRG